jgi:hypothetical protein
MQMKLRLPAQVLLATEVTMALEVWEGKEVVCLVSTSAYPGL